MGFLGKIIGGGIGWALGGPLGAILGVAIGSIVDNVKNNMASGNGTETVYADKTQTQQGDFEMSLIVLTAAMMKADGAVMKSELDFVKKWFLQQFGAEKAEAYIKILKNVLKQEYNIYEVANQINRYMDKASKLLLLQYLFGIASADKSISKAELDLIEVIATYFRISTQDYNSIKAMFLDKNDDYYTILEITPDASDEDVKKAYRRLAVKNHPDKVAHLGENAQKEAQAKFQKIKEAYDKIKLERGMK
ncbi:MAG: TerB family tellurite resistance protein [Bacteroidales bacterium]|nr:TerB family tellurite resistance protein [Bacteroidales bacterium]MDD3152823.1 TerB family tellurite resistance protein [Bacteroidales bacterium]